jgi:hypothetical protein
MVNVPPNAVVVEEPVPAAGAGAAPVVLLGPSWPIGGSLAVSGGLLSGLALLAVFAAAGGGAPTTGPSGSEDVEEEDVTGSGAAAAVVVTTVGGKVEVEELRVSVPGVMALSKPGSGPGSGA